MTVAKTATYLSPLPQRLPYSYTTGLGGLLSQLALYSVLVTGVRYNMR